jgi:hypothetical protein
MPCCFGEDQARYVVTVPSELSGYIMASAEGAASPSAIWAKCPATA